MPAVILSDHKRHVAIHKSTGGVLHLLEKDGCIKLTITHPLDRNVERRALAITVTEDDFNKAYNQLLDNLENEG